MKGYSIGGGKEGNQSEGYRNKGLPGLQCQSLHVSFSLPDAIPTLPQPRKDHKAQLALKPCSGTQQVNCAKLQRTPNFSKQSKAQSWLSAPVASTDGIRA